MERIFFTLNICFAEENSLEKWGLSRNSDGRPHFPTIPSCPLSLFLTPLNSHSGRSHLFLSPSMVSRPSLSLLRGHRLCLFSDLCSLCYRVSFFVNPTWFSWFLVLMFGHGNLGLRSSIFVDSYSEEFDAIDHSGLHCRSLALNRKLQIIRKIQVHTLLLWSLYDYVQSPHRGASAWPERIHEEIL